MRRDKGDEYHLVKLNRQKREAYQSAVIQNLLDDGHRDKPSSYVFVANNPILVSCLSALFVPYILGMLLMLVLFYFYVGVGISDFFHAYSGLSQLIFWVLGMYLIVTLFDLWFLVKKLIGI